VAEQVIVVIMRSPYRRRAAEVEAVDAGSLVRHVAQVQPAVGDAHVEDRLPGRGAVDGNELAVVAAAARSAAARAGLLRPAAFTSATAATGGKEQRGQGEQHRDGAHGGVSCR